MSSLRRHIMMQQGGGLEFLPYILCGGNGSYLNTHIKANSELDFEFWAGYEYKYSVSDYTYGVLARDGFFKRYHDQYVFSDSSSNYYRYWLANMNIGATLNEIERDVNLKIAKYKILGNSQGTFNTDLFFLIGGRNYLGTPVSSIYARRWAFASLTKNGTDLLKLRACKYNGKFGFWEINGVINPISGTPFWGSDGDSPFYIDY